MSDHHTPPASVLVIMDPDYGARLRTISPKQVIWITMSPKNEPVVRALRQEGAAGDLTSFHHSADSSPEESFLNELDAIDLHHGPYSSSRPYTQIEVIGANLTTELRAALSQLGFEEFAQS